MEGYSKSSYPIITFSSTFTYFYFVIEKEKEKKKDMGERV
jgi:hypothetical protein